MNAIVRPLFVFWCLTLSVFAAPEKRETLNFDFTPDAVSPVAGYVAVNEKSVYSAKTGYGWAREWGRAAKDDSAAAPLTRGAIGAGAEVREAEFMADLPDGAYEVDIIAGVSSPREGRLGICAALEDKVLIPPPGIG